MNQTDFANGVDKSIEAINTALRPLAPLLDRSPEANIALVAVLRAYASLLEEELPDETKVLVEQTVEVIIRTLKAGAV